MRRLAARCCGAQTSSRLNLGSSCYSYDGLWQGASPRPGNCWNSHRPPARRLQFPRPPSRVPPPPPECLMLHKGEAVARSRPRPAPSFPPCLIASSPGLQVLGVPHGTTTRVSHGVRHWCPTKCSPCPQSSPSLGQARGGQPSYGCHCHRRTCLHLLIVLGLLLACHGGAEKL